MQRRPGDPAILIADSTLAREMLGWKPEFTDLKDIVKHAVGYFESKNKRNFYDS